MSIDSQSAYWDKVAPVKTFTHPVNYAWLEGYLSKESSILDFGCGYGRVVGQLLEAGYKHVLGYDTSQALIRRGLADMASLPIGHIATAEALPVADDSQDCILLFAVLTCIPHNDDQAALLDLLFRKLKPGGLLYISDYYLQEGNEEAQQYESLNGDPGNYGVFPLPEGVTMRHHEREWIAKLTSKFELSAAQAVDVVTMNGHHAEAFQLVCVKPRQSL